MRAIAARTRNQRRPSRGVPVAVVSAVVKFTAATGALMRLVASHRSIGSWCSLKSVETNKPAGVARMLTSLRPVITPRIPAGYTHHIEGTTRPVFANRKSLSVIAVTVVFKLHHYLA